MNCCICNKVINPGEQYIIDVHGNRAHAHHCIEVCPVCERMIGEVSSYGKIVYPDGRYICGNCYMNNNPVIDKKLLEQAFFNAKHLLQEKGYNFPKITIHLASKDEFIQLGCHNETLGLTTSRISIGKETHQIQILYGLPILLSTGIIAHELLHSWLNRNGLRPEPVICEGLCELGAALVYKRVNTPFGKFLFRKLERNMLFIYSEGFKMMKNILETDGWEATREYVKNNSKNHNRILFAK